MANLKKSSTTSLSFFPDFDAFPLSPPSSKAEVIQNLTEERRQGEISASFKKGVEDFKLMLRTKLNPKRSVSGQGVVTGEGWSNILNSLLKLLLKAGRRLTLKGTLSRCSARANLTGFFHRKTKELSLCRVMPTRQSDR